MITMENEPVRLTGWWALVIGLLVEIGLLWSFDTPTKAIVAAVLVTITTRVGGIEWARRHAYAPATVNAELQKQARRILDDETGV